jgi:hypothetical protein
MPACPETSDADRWLERGLEPRLDDVLADPMLATVMTPRTVRLLKLAALLARMRAQTRQAA